MASSPPPLSAHRLLSAADPLFAPCRELYEASFPPRERHPLPWLERVLAGSDALGFHALALTQEGAFAGLLFHWRLPSCLYVEHLAIAPPRRGQGLGHAALGLVCGGELPVALEIEPVVDAATARRWSFYRSLGFVRLPCVHFQPPYRLGDEPLRLELLSHPRALDDAEIDSFEREWRTALRAADDQADGSLAEPSGSTPR